MSVASTIDSSETLASKTSPPSNDAMAQTSDVKNQELAHSDDQEKLAVAPDVCPNGGYGWVCVGACFLLNAHTWGLNSAYGVFLAYYLDNAVFADGSPLRYAFIGGLSIAMAMLVSPIATTLVRVYGTRTTCLIGVAFETASFIGASFATCIWHLFLSQGICFGWGMGFIFVASVNVPPQWFTTKRSLANATAAAGSGLGGLVYALAANAAIKSVGLPWAFRIIGIIAFAVNTTCALLLRDRNLQIGTTQLAFDYTLFKRWEFNMLQLWGFFSMLGYVVLLFSLPNYARVIGLTSRQGSVVGAVFQLGQMVGRPPVGYFSDSFGRINMSITMTFLGGFYCLVIWIFATSYGVLVFFALIAGTVAGTFWATVGPVDAEIVGLKHLPSSLSITWMCIVLPTTFSEAIALEIVNKSPIGYLGAQLFAGFTYIGAALCLWAVRTWKVGELERLAALEKDSGDDSSAGTEKVLVQKSTLVRRIFALRRV